MAEMTASVLARLKTNHTFTRKVEPLTRKVGVKFCGFIFSA